jgi:molecular chaperone GrpE
MKDKRTAPIDELDPDQEITPEPAEAPEPPAPSAQGDGSSASPTATPAVDLEADAMADDAMADDAIAGDRRDPRLAQVSAELEQAKDKYVRLLAEFDNFRRRSTKERQEAELRGMGNLIRGMLDALDDLARFAHVDPARTESNTLADGVAMVEKKLLKTLAGHGLEVVDPAGKPFDPALHEAISTAPAPDKASDHLVAQVFQVGYVFNGLLLRPARVVVQQWNG